MRLEQVVHEVVGCWKSQVCWLDVDIISQFGNGNIRTSIALLYFQDRPSNGPTFDYFCIAATPCKRSHILSSNGTILLEAVITPQHRPSAHSSCRIYRDACRIRGWLLRRCERSDRIEC
jgi:hypothetical protein